MDNFTISLSCGDILLLGVNIWVVIALIIILLIHGGRAYCGFRSKEVSVNELSIGVGGSTVNLSFSRKEQEIAYQLWVELGTRKISLPFEEDNDVIVEMYDSWYSFFGIARDLLKDIPANVFMKKSNLVSVTEGVLNCGLRPHLTKWQARFRKWYEAELKKEENINLDPQDIQKKYPKYKELIEDLQSTSAKMRNFRDLLGQIAFKK